MSNNFLNILTKGLFSSLKTVPVEDGKVRFTTDTNQLFVDADGERHEVSDVIRGYTESEIKSLLAPLQKLYLSTDTHKFFVCISGEWIVVGKNEWIGKRAEFDEAVKNGEILDGMTVYFTDDYTGDGADLSIYATREYTDNTFVAKEDGKGLSSVDVTSGDTEKWNEAYTTATQLNGDSSTEGSVAYRIAQIIANAPENYDTLKEIADWIENDVDGAAAMNSNIVKNTSDISILNNRTTGSFVKTGDSPASNVLDYAHTYFGYASDLTVYFLVRCSDESGNSSLSAHKYVKWTSQSYFVISSDGISVNGCNKWGTIVLDNDTGKTITVSPITEEMYLTLKKSTTDISTLSSNLPVKIKHTEIEVTFNSTDKSRGWFVVLGSTVGVSKSDIKNIIVTSFTAGMTVDGIQMQKEKSNDDIIILTDDIVADSTAKFGITIFY